MKNTEKKEIIYCSSGSEAFEKKFTLAREQMYEDSPFLYYLMSDVGFHRVRNFQAYAAVTMVHGQIKMLFNLDELDNDWWSVEDIKIVLLHETLHILFKHLLFMKDAELNHSLWNIAQDYVINHHIPSFVEKYDKLMEINDKWKKSSLNKVEKVIGFRPTKQKTASPEQKKLIDKINEEEYNKFKKIEPLFAACIYPKIKNVDGIKGMDFKTLTSTYVFECLFREAKKNGNVQYVKTDYHGISSEKTKKQGKPDDNEMEAKVRKHIAKAHKKSKADSRSDNGIGKVAGDLIAEVIQTINVKKNYKQILTNFAYKTIDKKAKRSWIRPSRRYPGQSPGRKQQRKPHVLMAFDTSGSMWDDDVMGNFKGQLSQLLNVCEAVTVVMGDTTETFRGDARKDKNILNKLKFSGGGGTSLQFMWDVAKEIKADGIICNTDGYINEPDTHNIPTVFMIYPHGQEFMPKTYINVKIDDCI